MDFGLSAILGTALTLIFTFVPQVKDWYEAKDARTKAQIMAFGLLIIGACVTALSCYGVISAVVCTQTGILTFITGTLLNALLAVGVNQGVHNIIRNFKKEADVVGVG